MQKLINTLIKSLKFLNLNSLLNQYTQNVYEFYCVQGSENTEISIHLSIMYDNSYQWMHQQ